MSSLKDKLSANMRTVQRNEAPAAAGAARKKAGAQTAEPVHTPAAPAARAGGAAQVASKVRATPKARAVNQPRVAAGARADAGAPAAATPQPGSTATRAAATQTPAVAPVARPARNTAGSSSIDGSSAIPIASGFDTPTHSTALFPARVWPD